MQQGGSRIILLPPWIELAVSKPDTRSAAGRDASRRRRFIQGFLYIFSLFS